MKLSFVIPNYNGDLLLKKNLPVLLKLLEKEAKNPKQEIELIIVDDGSKDDSTHVLEEFKTQAKAVPVKILRNENNRGFSPTVNRGVRAATGEVVVLLNTDVLPKENFLAPLVKHFEDELVFAVGCMDESVENGKTILRGRGIGKWERGFLFHSRGEVDKTETFWVSGGSGAFRKSLWDKLGGLCELYAPFYWEDIDLSYRAQKAGYSVLFEKESVVEHRHEEGAIQKFVKPIKIKTVSYRNQFFFVWLNITDSSFLLSHLLWLPYHLLTALKSGDTAFIMGFYQALTKLGAIRSFRKHNKRLFVVTDQDILHWKE